MARFETADAAITWPAGTPALQARRGGEPSSRGGIPRLLREFVQILDVRLGGGVDAGDFGVRRFDDVVLVGRVGAGAVSEAEVSGGKSERVGSEDVSGPGAGEAREHDRVDAGAAIDGES